MDVYRIATEGYAYSVGDLPILYSKNKGCTRQRAVALNCNVSGLTSNNRLVKRTSLSKTGPINTYSINRYNDGYSNITVYVTAYGETTINASEGCLFKENSHITVSFAAGTAVISEWGVCNPDGTNYIKQSSNTFIMPAKDISIKIVSVSTDPYINIKPNSGGYILAHINNSLFLATNTNHVRLQTRAGNSVLLQSIANSGYMHAFWTGIEDIGVFPINSTLSFDMPENSLPEVISNYFNIGAIAGDTIPGMEYEPVYEPYSEEEIDEDVTVFSVLNSLAERTLMYINADSEIKKTVSNSKQLHSDGLYNEIQNLTPFTLPDVRPNQYGTLSPYNERSIPVGSPYISVFFRINITKERIDLASCFNDIFAIGSDMEIAGYANNTGEDNFVIIKLIPYILDDGTTPLLANYTSMVPHNENSINSQETVTKIINYGECGSFTGNVTGGNFYLFYESDASTRNILCNYLYIPDLRSEEQVSNYDRLLSSLEIETTVNGKTTSRFIDFDYSQTNYNENYNFLGQNGFTVSCKNNISVDDDINEPFSNFEHINFSVIDNGHEKTEVQIANSYYNLDRAIHYVPVSDSSENLIFQLNSDMFSADGNGILNSIYVTISRYIEQFCFGNARNYKLQENWNFNDQINRGNGLLFNKKGIEYLRTYTNIFDDEKYDNGCNIQLPLSEIVKIIQRDRTVFDFVHDRRSNQINFTIKINNLISNKFTDVQTANEFFAYISFAISGNIYVFTTNEKLVTNYNQVQPSQDIVRYPRPVRTISEWAVKNEDSFVCRSTEKIANDGDRQLNERNVVVCQK